MTTPTLAHFGPRWDSGIFDDVDTVQVDPPVGESCAFCREPIADGDRGLLRSVVRDTDGDGRWVGVLEPVHAECDLRMALGGPDHLEGRCTCVGGRGHHTERTFREEALEVLAIENRRRAAFGLPAMW